MKNDTIAEVIALLNTANYNTETLNQKRDEVVSTLKKQLSIQRVVGRSEQLVCEYCKRGNKATCCDECVDEMNDRD